MGTRAGRRRTRREQGAVKTRNGRTIGEQGEVVNIMIIMWGGGVVPGGAGVARPGGRGVTDVSGGENNNNNSGYSGGSGGARRADNRTEARDAGRRRRTGAWRAVCMVGVVTGQQSERCELLRANNPVCVVTGQQSERAALSVN